MKTLPFLFAWLLFAPVLPAQLAVSGKPPKATAPKAIVKLTLKNELKEPVESARAVCFLMDPSCKVVGQSTKWVICGDTKDRPPLEPQIEAPFNFVVTAQNLTTTNLTARLEFSQLVLAGGKSGSVTAQSAGPDGPKPAK